jgi:anti-anti-sigma regulatory factor
MEMPERLGAPEALMFKQDLEPLLACEHPHIVFDCCQVRSVDGAGVEMMFQCFEEAIKRDGALKLAGLSKELSASQQLGRMFEAFATSDEAVRSFGPLPPRGAPTNSSSNYDQALKKQAS